MRVAFGVVLILLTLFFAMTGVGYGQMHSGEIAATAVRVRTDAVDLYRRVTEKPMARDFEWALQNGGTNVLVMLKTSIPGGWFSDCRRFSVNVFVSRDEQRKVIVVRTLEDIGGESVRESVYDESGQVVWALSFDSQKQNGVRAGKLKEAFEFDRKGRLLRAWRHEGAGVMVSSSSKNSFHVETGQHSEWALFSALSAARSGLTLDDGSLEARMVEDLSHFFDSIAFTNNTSLSVKMLTWGRQLEERHLPSKIWRQCPRGGVSVSAPWGRMEFRRGARSWKFSLGGEREAERIGLVLPSDFSSKSNLVFCLSQGRRSVISPDVQKVFFPREHLTRDFKFPFNGLWKDEEMLRRWNFERGYRNHLGAVLRDARLEKCKGIELYQIVTMGEGKDLLKDVPRVRASTNIVVTSGSWLAHHRLKTATIQVVPKDDVCHVVGIFAEEDSERGVLRSYLYHAGGGVKWAFAIVKPEAGFDGRRMLDQQRCFEFAENGELHRALLPGAVLTHEDGEYKFSSDLKKHRQFLEDWGQAVEAANGQHGEALN